VCPDASSRTAFFRGKRASELLAEYEVDRRPTHVAIIMDGNGRWAEKRSLPRLAGHRAGAKALREVIAAAIELEISFLTIYSFSSENWARPKDEVSGLMALFVEVLERELVELERLHVRVRVIGETEALPAATRRSFDGCVARTASNDGMTLVVALNYGARNDIVRAVKEVVGEVCDGRLDSDAIDESLLHAHMSTATIPDPDLIIRTSGEMRLSNFLLWEAAYSELWVTHTLWPDFSRADLLKAVVDYQKRQRRFGGHS
jgi:undecaprenyl diphosphate synthase